MPYTPYFRLLLRFCELDSLCSRDCSSPDPN